MNGISLPGFALMRAIGQQRGITDVNALNRLSLIGGVVGLSPLGIIVGDSLIRQELESTTPAPSTSPTPSGENKRIMPGVVGNVYEDAKAILEGPPFSFKVSKEELPSLDVTKDKVIAQTPPQEGPAVAGQEVFLTVGLGRGKTETRDIGAVARVSETIEAISVGVQQAAPTVVPHIIAAVDALKKSAAQEVEQSVGLPAATKRDQAKQKPGSAIAKDADQVQENPTRS